MGLDDDQFVAVESISPNLRCPICSGVFDDPVFASGQPCHCTFCRHCITSWLSKDAVATRSCPICRKRLELSTMVPNSMIQNFICEQIVYCRYRPQGCYWTGRHDTRRGHDVDCLVRRVIDKDNIIHALSQKLEEQERVIQDLRRAGAEHAEMKAWVSNFLSTAPTCMAGLLPASVASSESTPSSSSMAFPDRRAKLKKVVKEGSKTGIERESATILGGLEFFCTAVEEPTGDVEMLMECLTAMNAKTDTMQEDHIGKMLFSAGASQLAVVAYVPPAKHRQVSSDEWLQVVLHAFGGRVLNSTPDVSVGIVKSSPEKDYLRLQASAIDEAKNFLRRKGLLPEESDGPSDEDETY